MFEQIAVDADDCNKLAASEMKRRILGSAAAVKLTGRCRFSMSVCKMYVKFLLYLKAVVCYR
jgi:hypothetical protein